MTRQSVFVIALGIVALAVPGARAQGVAPITLQIATLTPSGYPWNEALEEWSVALRERTNGRLVLDVQAGWPSDERANVARLRAHQLDGASVSAIGIGEIAPSVLVLQAPGIFEDHAALDRARTRMDGALRAELARNGAELMGWSEYGSARIFSTRAIAQPSDLRGARAPILPGDPILPDLLHVVGGTGLPTTLDDVPPALSTRYVDTVIASALAARALRWETRVTHVTQQSGGVLIGATLFDAQRVNALPADLRAALLSTAAPAHARMRATVRQQDERFFARLTHRIRRVDASAHDAAWQTAAQQTRARLVGRLFTQQQLDRAIAAAAP